MNLTELLLHWGPLRVFGAVFIEQLGLPLSAVPHCSPSCWALLRATACW